VGQAWGGSEAVVAFVEPSKFEVFEVDGPLGFADWLGDRSRAR